MTCLVLASTPIAHLVIVTLDELIGMSQLEKQMNEIETLINDFDRPIHSNERDRIVGEIVAMGNDAFPLLQRGLKGSNERIKIGCMLALGKLGDLRAERLLIEACNDDDLTIRQFAISALTDLGSNSKAALAVLQQALTHEYAPIRESAAYGLSKLPDKTSIEALLAILDDSDPEVRDEAGYALEAIGEAAVPSLISTLDDDSLQRRKGAAEVLGKIGDQRAIAPLKRLLGDSDEELRLMAEISLRELGEP